MRVIAGGRMSLAPVLRCPHCRKATVALGPNVPHPWCSRLREEARRPFLKLLKSKEIKD